MFSEALLDHFRNPRRAGALDEPAVTVRVENPVCGDILSISARMSEGAIRDARFKARGCTASIAAGSALADLLVGRRKPEVAAIAPAEIEAELGGLPNESKHAARLAADAARALADRL